MSKKESGKETQKIESAKDVDSRDGLLGQEKITAVEKFARCLLNAPYIWWSYKTSDYAVQKPIRTLLKAYRMFRSLSSEERRFQMASELRQIFLNPPTGVSGPDYSEVDNKSFEVTDEFLNLLGFLYADIPSLVSRNENRLSHAVELAFQLNIRQARIESRKNRADKSMRSSQN